MFRMLGKKVVLIRYKINYTENEIEMQESCISTEHKNEIGQMLTEKEIAFTTTPIDQTSNEWLNGLEFSSYDEALIVFNNGEQIYNQNTNLIMSTSNEQLRADTDYISIMVGVDL